MFKIIGNSFQGFLTKETYLDHPRPSVRGMQPLEAFEDAIKPPVARQPKLEGAGILCIGFGHISSDLGRSHTSSILDTQRLPQKTVAFFLLRPL